MVASMRKGLAYLLVLLILLYGAFLLVQTGGIENRGQPTGRHLVRLNQLDPGQYASIQEYHTWASSTCSTAAMTEVANYYGGNYRITDLLAVEAHIGEITPELGLLEDAGIAHTVAHFGFVTSWGYGRTLDQLVALANGGMPVIVAFPPSRYPGGHLLVVIGGDGARVLVADSSIWNRTSFSRTHFLMLWAGFAAVVTPQER
jgi:ABC-type bacteriocin/lantibiotic exporter with double-glycine peptidase domain